MTGIHTSISSVGLDALEQRYVEVIRELSVDANLDPFRVEFEKVHRLLQKSLEGEKKLIGKIKELKDELSTQFSKMETAVQLSQEDEGTISSLRVEIERAWAMADTAHQREKESREKIQLLKQQVTELDSLVSQSAGLTMGQEAYLRDLMETKRQLEDEHVHLTSRVTHLSEENREYRQKLQQAQAEEAVKREEYNRRLAAYQAILADLEVQQKERAMKELSAKEYRTTAEKHVVELEKRRVQLENCYQEEGKLKKDAEELAEVMQGYQHQVEDLQLRFKAEAGKLTEAERKNNEIKSAIPVKLAALKEKDAELAKEKSNLRVAERKARIQQGELDTLVKERDALILQNNELTAEIVSLVENMAKKEKEIAAVEADVKKAMNEKSNVLAENFEKGNERSHLEIEKTLAEGKRKGDAEEFHSISVANEAMRKRLFELEVLHQKEIGTAQILMLEYHRNLDQIRMKRDDGRKLRDVLAAHEKKQKMQQELLERVTVDRNRTEKQLRDAEMEWQEHRERYHNKNEEIELMKADLITKEGQLCQLHTVSKQIHRETACTEQRASHLKEDCLHASTRILALNEEVFQLNQVIAKCDADNLREEMRLKSITNERNILATQLIRRNEELRLLYDRIQLQQSMLEKGALDYAYKVNEIVDAKDELTELQLKCRMVLIRLRYLERLKKKELAGEKMLTQEKARVRCLTEELSKPVNVHRWRQLEGSHPLLLDEIAKVQLLQKKLLSKCDECHRKQQKIEKKEAEYVSLRRRLARLPGPEAGDDLALYHENIVKRKEQIQMMNTELHTIEEQVEFLTDEVRQLNEELWEAKNKCIKAKAKNDLLVRERKTMQKTWGSLAPAAHAAIYHRARSPASLNSSNDDASKQRLTQGNKLTRENVMKSEEALLKTLTAGEKASNFPLTKPKGLKAFAGGGFALTR